MTTVCGIHHFAHTAGDTDTEIRFHEGVLGLRTVGHTSVTVRGRAAGRVFFASTDDPADAFLLSYCLGADGPVGRLGSNGPKTANLSVPRGALEFWRRRLHDAHIGSERVTRLGTERLEFTNPAGVLYSLVETDGNHMAADGSIDPAFAIRGLHSVTISLMDVREMHSFLVDVLEAQHVRQDLAWGLYTFGADPLTPGLELLHEPYRAPGTWTYAVGTPHHIAMDASDPGRREHLRARLLDAGYADVSAVADDKGFTSVWVRTPGGTLVDLLCTA